MAAGKIEVALPAIDLNYFRPTPKKDETFRVLAVLTIDPRKGVYYLLQAFEKAAIPNSELVIIGATGDRWSRELLRQFMARMSNIRLQSADVLKDPLENYLWPSECDGSSRHRRRVREAVGQALACGKPVIATPPDRCLRAHPGRTQWLPAGMPGRGRIGRPFETAGAE